MKLTALLQASIIAAATFALPAAATTLQTPLNGGNGNAGIMFDIIVGTNALTLTELGANIAAGPFDYQFYTITGGIGAEGSNPAAWTLRDSFTGVAGPGNTSGQPGSITTFDITDFVLAANTTYGLYLTATTGGTRLHYTNLEIGSVVSSNADLTIMSGFGKTNDFGGGNVGRAFNGSLTYTGGAVPEPASWALMIGGFGLVGASMRRRRASFTAA
jgi:hypothetical protein